MLIARESRYGFSFMNMGFTPGMGTTAMCEHVLSPAVAHELMYSGEMRRGAELAGSGINYVLPRVEVDARAFDVAADGFWHYMHFYFAQVVYRTGGDDWNRYRGELHEKLLREMQQGGGWQDLQVGTVYATAVNCIMLQLDRGFLPIYQR